MDTPAATATTTITDTRTATPGPKLNPNPNPNITLTLTLTLLGRTLQAEGQIFAIGGTDGAHYLGSVEAVL